jgi:diguanylate cyclase (GGDEF)-like protein
MIFKNVYNVFKGCVMLKNPYKGLKAVKRYLFYYILLSLAIVFAIVFTRTIVTNNYISEAESKIDFFAQFIETRIDNYNEANEQVERILEDKLFVTADYVIDNFDEMSNEVLQTYVERFNVTTLMISDPTFTIVLSNLPEFVGNKVTETHPLYSFLISDEQTYIETIRPSELDGKYYKFGNFKFNDGYMLQVAIEVSNHQMFIEKLTIQSILEEISAMGDVLFARFISTNFEITAHSNPELIGTIVQSDHILEVFETEEAHTYHHYHNLEDVISYCIVRPVYVNDELIGVLNIGFASDYVLPTLNTITNAVIIIGIYIYFVVAVSAYYGTRTRARIYEAAFIDPLTGLGTRTAIELDFDKLRKNQTINDISFMMVNIDKFKSINDLYGMKMGDDIITHVGNKLKTVVNAIRIYRLQADDFVLFFKNVDVAFLTKIADQLTQTVFQEFEVNNLTFNISLTVAIVLASDKALTDQTIIRKLTSTMREAKRIKKGSYIIYGEDLVRQLHYRDEIEKELRYALKDPSSNILSIVLQPMYDLTNKLQVSGFEALCRLNSPKLGYVSPLDFISVAEEVGLIQQLDRFVVLEAIKFQKQIKKLGLNPLPISVNFSVIEMMDENFADDFLSLIKEQEVCSKCIEIEITESSFAFNYQALKNTLAKLQENDVKLYIDDFGTGYSSLAYLKIAKIDYIKLDRIFTQALSVDEKDYTILEAVIQIATSMNAKVVAEGVETKEQLQILEKMKCHLVQGYYLNRPLKLIDAEQLMVTHFEKQSS